MFIQKFLGIILTSSVVIAFLSGCSEKLQDEVDTSIGAMENFKVGDTFRATEPIKISIFYQDHPNYPSKEDWLLWEKIKEITNVELEKVIIPLSDYKQKASLLLNSGDAAFIIPKFTPGDEVNYISSGVLLPVSDYVHLMPYFQDTIEKWNLYDDINGLRQLDGKYYMLPGMHEIPFPNYTLAMRTDILDENNLEIPTTWDEFYTVLKELKAVYPDKIPFSDRWSHEGGALINLVSLGFDTKAGWNFGQGLTFDSENDKFVYTAATDNYRDLVEYLHKLVDEGLLDPESFSQTDDIANQKFVSEDSFVIGSNSQELINYRITMEQTLGEGNFKVENIRVPGGPKGDLADGGRLEFGLMIPSKAKDSVNFEAQLQFIDWLWYSPEGQEFAKWGIEGITYTKNENGFRELMPDISYKDLNLGAPKKLNVDFGFSGGVFAYGGSTELRHSMMSEEELKFHLEMAEKTFRDVAPPAPLADIQREQATMLSVPLKDYVFQNTALFITGSRSLNEYDEFILELEAKGANEYVDMINTAYEEFKIKNP